MAASLDIDDYDDKTETFLAWLQERPGATINPKIHVADLRHIGVGRGVVAVEDIEDDEELFSISIGDVLSVENSSLNLFHPEIIQQLDSWNSLILTMIYEDGRGRKSKWWPYLNILPTHFNTLIYWSSSELAELQGSAVIDKIGKDAAERSFSKILLPTVKKHCQSFGNHAASFQTENASQTLIDLAHRMATLIMAYGFDLENEPASEEEEEEGGSSQQAYESNKAMVPLADMFNADGDLNNAHLLQNEKSMTMIALKPITKGEQIFNDFGQLPRSDLLRRYGYITDRYKKWDVVEVDIEAIKIATAEQTKMSNEEQEQRLQLAADWEVLQDGYDLSRPREATKFEFDDDLILTITALLLDAAFYETANATNQVPDRAPASMHMPLCKVLKSIIARRTEAYKTTISEDVALLADPSIVGRHRMAVEVRLGEKEILVTAANEIDRRLTRLSQAQNEADSSNITKKRKF